MRFIGFVLAVLFALQSTCWLPAFAETSASFNAATGVHAEVPVNKIGTLLLADAVAFLNGSTIEVQTNSQGNSSSQLTGNVQNAQVVGTGENAHIQGTASFTGGPMLGKLGKNHSFNFDITMGAVPVITFTVIAPAATNDVKVKHPGHSTTFKVIVGVVIVAGIATAIALPIALHHRPHRPTSQQQAALQAQAILRNQINSQMVSSVISTPFVPPPVRPPTPPPSPLFRN